MISVESDYEPFDERLVMMNQKEINELEMNKKNNSKSSQKVKKTEVIDVESDYEPFDERILMS